MTVRTGFLGALAAATLLLTACIPGGTPAPSAAASSPGDTEQSHTAQTLTVALDSRPFSLHVPASYKTGKPAALVILLHGYTASGQGQESYLKFIPESDNRGFLYAFPDGTKDTKGNRFWNATDACCNLYGAQVDDSTYISDIIKNVQSSYTVDAKRVYLVGHSNGAFMSYRMACDHADQITAIASLNGAMWSDLSRCKPSSPVSVLDIRSTADETILFAGGAIAGHPYPSAATTEADWRAFDHCTATATHPPAIDLDGVLPGAETTVSRFATGCASGSTVEVWQINGGMHVPPFGPGFARDVMNFLLAQVKR